MRLPTSVSVSIWNIRIRQLNYEMIYHLSGTCPLDHSEGIQQSTLLTHTIQQLTGAVLSLVITGGGGGFESPSVFAKLDKQENSSLPRS